MLKKLGQDTKFCGKFFMKNLENPFSMLFLKVSGRSIKNWVTAGFGKFDAKTPF